MYEKRNWQIEGRNRERLVDLHYYIYQNQYLHMRYQICFDGFDGHSIKTLECQQQLHSQYHSDRCHVES